MSKNVLLLFIFIPFSTYSKDREIPTEGKTLETTEGEIHYFKEGDRLIGLWPPRIYSNRKLSWQNGARENRLKFFNEDLKKYLDLFEKEARKFNSCIENKKWPEKVKCVEEYDICFGGQEYATSACGFESGKGSHVLSESCDPDLLSCMKKNERDFQIYSQCFNLSKDIVFRFYVTGLKGEREELVQMRVTGGPKHPKFYEKITCDFSIVNNRLSLVELIYSFIIAKPYGVNYPKSFKPKYVPQNFGFE